MTDYRYIHLGIGIVGNAMFCIGSVLFFERFADLYTAGVWLFVLGSLFMLFGAIGELAKEIYQSRARRSSAARD